MKTGETFLARGERSEPQGTVALVHASPEGRDNHRIRILLSRTARGTYKHWHSDASYVKIRGTLYNLFGLLNSYSCHMVHREIREQI